MIVGHGAIAKVLTDRNDRLYFASGVADSQEMRESQFERERDLLTDQDRHRHTVYFSSLCVFNADTLYARHKRSMETLVKDSFPSYTIMRLGNIKWARNRKQLIPFIKEQILTGQPFKVYNEYRHILELDDFLYWVDQIPPWNCEMNVTGERVKIDELVVRLRRELRQVKCP